MKKTTKLLALLFAAAFSVAMLAGCGSASSASSVASSAASSVAASSQAEQTGIEATLNVTDKDGNVQAYTLNAQEGESLADALLAAELISQEEHDSGFVTVVGGVATDYNADQSWWMLVDANGEMTAVGIADIALAAGDVYGFIYTVG